jgi:hypothetical protein
VQAAGPAQAAGPVLPRSLANELDKPSAADLPVRKRGELRFVLHRRASSFHRFWFGPLLSVAAIGAAVAMGRSHFSNVADVYLTLDCLAGLGILLFLNALVASRYTTYTVYERRIDFRRGIFSRHAESRWLYDIKRLEWRQPPLLTLTGTGRIDMDLDASANKAERDHIVATGSSRRMRAFMEELQDNALQERRAMKGIWT